MLKWIKTLNEMYDANPCTDNGRVVVEYCPNLRVVVIKVRDEYKVIDIDNYTDWGILTKIQDIVREMYEAV